MTHSFSFLLVCLITGIAVIVVLTTRFKIHAFFALILAAALVGLAVGLPLTDTIATMKNGFGGVMMSLGLLIVLGTTLGVMLEYTGATEVMANAILKLTGQKRAAWAMSITGFIVGLPIFCDSGFLVLIGLNKNLSARTGIPMAVMATSLATGLLAIHCMAPPHPGITAAAAKVGVDIAKLMLYGAITALPAMIVGGLWCGYAGKKYRDEPAEAFFDEKPIGRPSVLLSFLPVVVPLLLIAFKSFYTFDPKLSAGWLVNVLSAGDPIAALAIGVLLTFFCKRRWTQAELGHLLRDAVEKAGGVLIIIGAGGAFGAILAATKIGLQLSQSLNLAAMGLFFPFLLTSLLKTAQGSSTVAIMTAASIVGPLVAGLGLGTDAGKLLCVLAMGAGSMVVSHANDGYFWAIAKFSGLEMKTMLRTYTIATLLMGITSFAAVLLLSKLI